MTGSDVGDLRRWLQFPVSTPLTSSQSQKGGPRMANTINSYSGDGAASVSSSRSTQSSRENVL